MDLKNTTFVCGKAEEVIIKWKQQGIKPDVVMVDPPRKGCDETFLQTLLKLNPKRIVYISCNPSTQQRDAQILDSQYELQEITPVDMFPQTTHVETVALFENLKREILIQILRNGYRALNLIKSFFSTSTVYTMVEN